MIEVKLDTQEKILKYILEQYPGLKNRHFTSDDSLVGVLDSLAVLGVIGFIEPEFGVEFSPSDVTDENFASVAAIAECVTRLNQPPVGAEAV
jgi:acyl carrier protein